MFKRRYRIQAVSLTQVRKSRLLWSEVGAAWTLEGATDKMTEMQSYTLDTVYRVVDRKTGKAVA